jgi:homoserine kinase
MKQKALELGALGFSISGSGPSMFALCSNTFASDNIVEAAKELYGKDRHGRDAAKVYQAPINLEGAEVC